MERNKRQRDRPDGRKRCRNFMCGCNRTLVARPLDPSHLTSSSSPLRRVESRLSGPARSPGQSFRQMARASHDSVGHSIVLERRISRRTSGAREQMIRIISNPISDCDNVRIANSGLVDKPSSIPAHGSFEASRPSRRSKFGGAPGDSTSRKGRGEPHTRGAWTPATPHTRSPIRALRIVAASC
jgi:hypothetical protein